MSWGTELWDQFENILLHTQKGVDLCEKVSSFTKERCNIELEYANKLKKLVKAYLPKKNEEDELTTIKGFMAMIKEISDIAGQHETISESLLATVWNGSQNLAQELKQERKKAMQEAYKHQAALQAQLAQCNKAKKLSEKAYRDTEKAQEAYKKASEDQNLSRSEVDKTKQTWQLRQQAYEQSKLAYAAEVQKTNNVQNDHYHVLMPQVFSQLQLMDEKRIAKIKAFIHLTADTEQKIIPIINRCVDDIVTAASIVDYEQEMKVVIDSYKTGFSFPPDVPFEDVTISDSGKGTVNNTLSHSKKDRKRPGILTMRTGQKDDIQVRDDFSHLPPNQQKRQLALKIDFLKGCLAKENAEREGLMRLQDVYRRNASLGDPNTIEDKLKENTSAINQFQLELNKYEGHMILASRRLATDFGTSSSTVQTKSSEKESTTNKNNATTPSKPSTPPKKVSIDLNCPLPGSISLQAMFPEAPPPTAKRNTFPSQDTVDCGSEDEFIDGGSCTALYDFDGSTEGCLAMKAGQELTIIERDDGDGWVNVQSHDGQRGFVPATYIKYNSE